MANPHLRSVLVGLVTLLSASGALAQADSTKAAPKTAESAAVEQPVAPTPAAKSPDVASATATPEGAAETATEAPKDACFPSCRDGYLCHESKCISACNPACEADELCMEGRACVPKSHMFPSQPQYAPWPPLPARTADTPPPPSGFRQPRFPPAQRPRRSGFRGPRFQGYIGFQLGLGGGGKLETADQDDRDFLGIERGFDLNASGGVEAIMEFRVARFFGIGPGLRVFRVRGDNDIGAVTTFDLLVAPTFHIPLQGLEIFIPIPLGLSFGSVPDRLPGDSTAGLTVGLNPGLLAWVSDSMGVYAQLGVQAHFQGYEELGENYVLRFHRPTLTVGISLRD